MDKRAKELIEETFGEPVEHITVSIDGHSVPVTKLSESMLSVITSCLEGKEDHQGVLWFPKSTGWPEAKFKRCEVGRMCLEYQTPEVPKTLDDLVPLYYHPGRIANDVKVRRDLQAGIDMMKQRFGLRNQDKQQRGEHGT